MSKSHPNCEKDYIILTHQALSFFSRFLGYGKKQALPFSLAFIGYGLYALSQPAFAMLMEAFVRALEGEYADSLYVVPLMCVVIALFRGLGSYLGSYYMSKAGANIVHSVRCDMYENIVRLPMKFLMTIKAAV